MSASLEESEEGPFETVALRNSDENVEESVILSPSKEDGLSNEALAQLTSLEHELLIAFKAAHRMIRRKEERGPSEISLTSELEALVAANIKLTNEKASLETVLKQSLNQIEVLTKHQADIESATGGVFGGLFSLKKKLPASAVPAMSPTSRASAAMSPISRTRTAAEDKQQHVAQISVGLSKYPSNDNNAEDPPCSTIPESINGDMPHGEDDTPEGEGTKHTTKELKRADLKKNGDEIETQEKHEGEFGAFDVTWSGVETTEEVPNVDQLGSVENNPEEKKGEGISVNPVEISSSEGDSIDHTDGQHTKAGLKKMGDEIVTQRKHKVEFGAFDVTWSGAGTTEEQAEEQAEELPNRDEIESHERTAGEKEDKDFNAGSDGTERTDD